MNKQARDTGILDLLEVAADLSILDEMIVCEGSWKWRQVALIWQSSDIESPARRLNPALWVISSDLWVTPLFWKFGGRGAAEALIASAQGRSASVPSAWIWAGMQGHPVARFVMPDHTCRLTQRANLTWDPACGLNPHMGSSPWSGLAPLIQPKRKENHLIVSPG